MKYNTVLCVSKINLESSQFRIIEALQMQACGFQHLDKSTWICS